MISSEDVKVESYGYMIVLKDTPFEFASGQVVSSPLVFHLIDQDGNVFEEDSKSVIWVI